MFAFLCFNYVAVIPILDNIRKPSALVFLMFRAYVNAYVAAVLTSVMFMLMR